MQSLRFVRSILSTRPLRNTILATALVLAPAASFAGVFISVGIAPPALPVYAQPACPGDGFLWTPGYWAYGPAGYYWVPGVWVRPPRVGVLWTPGYWGWGSGSYVFHEGYWGPHIGFYGGVNYGFGYTGVGFEGGYWHGDRFAYNRAVTNVDVHFSNVYSHNVVMNNGNRVSYNGGNGGIALRASEREQAAIREQHVSPTGMQMSHMQEAGRDRMQLASVNGGRPQMVSARTPDDYRSVARQHAASQPITERDRAANQQSRIGNGVRSGELRPGETRNLENRESSINRQAAADRSANGGRLNPQERQQINQRQDNVNRSINNDKHNGATDRAVQQQHQQRPENNSGGGDHGPKPENKSSGEHGHER